MRGLHMVAQNLSGGLVVLPAAQRAPPRSGQQPGLPGGIPTMSVADDPRLLPITPRPVLPPPAHGRRPPPAHAGRRAVHAGGARDACHAPHTRYAPAQWRDFYLTTMRHVDFAAYSRAWGMSLAERFTSYMAIIRDILVNISAKPDDDGDMTAPVRCVNTAAERAKYDAELAQDAQRQAEAEATQAHIARVCLAELDAIFRHCDAARFDRAPHITCTNTADMVHRALVARPATANLAKHTLTIPPPPTSVAADAEPVQAGAWRSWYYAVLGLKPGWLTALHYAQHADDDAAREKQEAEITKLCFTNRQEAHARLRGRMLSVSPTLTATPLLEFYSNLATGSILPIDDVVQYVIRGAHHTYETFLVAARTHQHTGAFWHDLGLRTFCTCTTDRCTLDCRQGRKPLPGMFNPHHDIRPDCNFSTVTVTWVLTG